MSNNRLTPARRKALKCLDRIELHDSFADNVLAKLVDASDMPDSEKAFASLLVLGVVSSKGSLDSVIDRFLDKPKGINGSIRNALRISSYEVIYLGKDQYASVDQGVELARAANPRMVGLANAVLRKVAASKADFPFGDPSSDIEAYSLEHAFPVWLVEDLVETLGKKAANEFVRACNEPAPVFVAFNAVKDAKLAMKKMLFLDDAATEVSVDGIDVCNSLKLSSPKAVAHPGFLKLVESGRLLVSDASAQLICQLACETLWHGCKPGTSPVDLSCLELCAGRGTKTILLQSAMKEASGGQFGRFVAVDNIEFKAELLERRAGDYSVHLDESICCDATNLDDSIHGEMFDLVFLDAPCSGIGTMRRHPEIRWRVSPENIEENSLLDSMLIREAAAHVKLGGMLVYSTCTVTRRENEDVVEAFLSSCEGEEFEPVGINGRQFMRTSLHSGGYDAHFCALLARKGLT